MTLASGTTVGRYQILEPLGQGGMATVYKAFQPSLEREVALKVLRPGFAQDSEFRERFEREAKAIAKLRQPHIVQVFDFEITPSGEYVLAMEYLEGGTLKDRISALAAQGRGFDPEESLRIVSEVAEALTYAHEKGIVHRDVKPSNVMLTQKDWAVVTDFGIARILGATSHTQTGVGIGTPEYMAPEQGQGGRIDHRADIYSLGAMAYELLTGRVPYTADTPLAVVIAHIKDPLPLPSKVNPTIGSGVEKALLRALAKDPAQRYESATAFAEALKAGLAEDSKGGTMPTIVVRSDSALAPTSDRSAVSPRGGALPSIPFILARRPIVTGVAAVVVFALVVGGVVAGNAFRPAPEPLTAPSVEPARSAAVALPTAGFTSIPPTAAPATSASSPTTATTAPLVAVTSLPVGGASAPATVAATAVGTTAPTQVPTLAPTPAPTSPPTPRVEFVGPVIAIGSGQPEAIAINSRTGRAYLANGGANAVVVIDTTAKTAVGSIPVGAWPARVAVNATTNRIYVPNRDSGDLSVIDGASGAVVATVALGPLVEGILVNERTNRVYVTSRGSDTLFVVDGATNAVTARLALAQNSGPIGLAFNATTGRLFVTHHYTASVSLIDEPTLRIIRTVAVGANPNYVAADASIDRVYVANSRGNNVTVLDGSTGALVATIPVGSFPIGIAVDSTSGRAYVANGSSGTISVIDTTTDRVLRTLRTDSPYGLAVDPDSHSVYVANQVAKTVTVIQ